MTPQNTAIKIDIGSGYKKIPGFIRIDSDKNCKPDILMNLETDKIPLEDNSVDFIRASHILEHIGDGFFHLLQEIYRVSKPNAQVYIEVPHFNHDIFKIDPTHKRSLTVESFRLFDQEYNQKTIRENGTTSTLGIMYNVNFKIIQNEYILDPFYETRIKNLDEETYIRLGREANNVCIEEKILLQVIK